MRGKDKKEKKEAEDEEKSGTVPLPRRSQLARLRSCSSSFPLVTWRGGAFFFISRTGGRREGPRLGFTETEIDGVIQKERQQFKKKKNRKEERE